MLSCRGKLADASRRDPAANQVVVDEAWGVYGARFQLPAAAERVQSLLVQIFSVVPKFRSQRPGVLQQQMLSATLPDLQHIMQPRNSEAAKLAEQEAQQLRQHSPDQAARLPHDLVVMAAAVHVEAVKLCSSRTFVQENGLYLGQDAMLRQWLRYNTYPAHFSQYWLNTSVQAACIDVVQHAWLIVSCLTKVALHLWCCLCYA